MEGWQWGIVSILIGRDMHGGVGLQINMLSYAFLAYTSWISLNFGYLSTVDVCGLTF
jgi:hypothetical protein